MKQLASTKTGVEAVLDFVNVYDVLASPDGLEFASPDDFSKWNIVDVAMPGRLRAFLEDLRLLRRIPISYLVPDPDLLPPESIRFFHVNQTWIDRVVDGVFSNTNVGTVDFHYSLTTLQLVRKFIDPVPGGMTGILIRSELVRRWPKMIVRAFSSAAAGIDDDPPDPSKIEVPRAEAISRDIFIALFEGQPKRIHIREPFEGVRFGVETDDDGDYVVDQRKNDGTAVLTDDGTENKHVHVPMRSAPLRTIGISSFGAALEALAAGMGDARGVALHLEQRPFVQVFLDSVPESQGSVPPPPNRQVLLRNGKLFTLKFAEQALFTLDV